MPGSRLPGASGPLHALADVARSDQRDCPGPPRAPAVVVIAHPMTEDLVGIADDLVHGTGHQNNPPVVRVAALGPVRARLHERAGTGPAVRSAPCPRTRCAPRRRRPRRNRPRPRCATTSRGRPGTAPRRGRPAATMRPRVARPARDAAERAAAPAATAAVPARDAQRLVAGDVGAHRHDLHPQDDAAAPPPAYRRCCRCPRDARPASSRRGDRAAPPGRAGRTASARGGRDSSSAPRPGGRCTAGSSGLIIGGIKADIPHRLGG
ncbi:hypothetical protein SBADM41S_08832 [Streptomyces badius]